MIRRWLIGVIQEAMAVKSDDARYVRILKRYNKAVDENRRWEHCYRALKGEGPICKGLNSLEEAEAACGLREKSKKEK